MSHIKTYARVKPAQQLYSEYEVLNKKKLSIRVPELLRDCGLVASKNRAATICYDFQFDKIFDEFVAQDEVFNIGAKEIVTGFLDGYNGTIFAYGQTGTGKTYTVEGSAGRYSDRGLAPRALTEIYKRLAERDDEDISVHISFLEIYQEQAYDLLSTSARTSSPVVVFPKVNVVEGANGTCVIRNLSVHLAPSEDVAHSLLLQGQANRKVAETPVNQRSSRSHAVFTIYLTAKKPDADTIVSSKLHLVDLAGSERVAKTGVDGRQLTEAKSINLSLHHLETVIIALQADSRPRSTSNANRTLNSSSVRPASSEGVRRHVPYRNSVLTMVLRDSLGGNCLTAMIATISLEVLNLGESLSTCRFAQRVACISNHARRNEEVDDKTLIQHLRRRVAELEAQLACLKIAQGMEGEGRQEEDDTSSKLTDEDKLACAQIVQEYLAGRVADPITAGITNPFKFRECLRILKKMVMNKYFQGKLANGDIGSATNSANQNTGARALTNGRAGTGNSSANQTASFGNVNNGREGTANSSTNQVKDAWGLTNGRGGTANSSTNQTKDAWAVINGRGEAASSSANQPAAPQGVANGRAEELEVRGHVEVLGNSQVLRLDDLNSADASHSNSFTQPSSGEAVVNQEDLIRNIQQLYAASRTEPKPRQRDQSPHASQSFTSTPPRSAARPEYKSPFERNREKEIKKLNRKVNTMKQEQSSHEQHLSALRNSTALGELVNMENIIRKKIQVTRDQIADQHAYRLHLRHTEASPETLQREKLVEDQLIKREVKFERKLEEVVQKKTELEAQATQDGEGAEVRDSEGQGQGLVKVGDRRNLEEQFAQFKKRNGTLNTRQVFDMLKSEEKKTVKAVRSAEEEQKYLMSKQLAMKEETTRQKLRELKDMLRRSREEAVFGQGQSPFSNQGNGPFGNQGNGPYGNSFLYHQGYPANFTFNNGDANNELDVVDVESGGDRFDRTFDKPNNTDKRKDEEAQLQQHQRADDLESSLTRGDHDNEGVATRKSGGGGGDSVPHQQQQLQYKQQNYQTVQKQEHKSEANPNPSSRNGSQAELRWDSAYSRPSTAHSTHSQELVEPRIHNSRNSQNSDSNWQDSAARRDERNRGSTMRDNKSRAQGDSGEEVDEETGRISMNSLSSDPSSWKSLSPSPLDNDHQNNRKLEKDSETKQDRHEWKRVTFENEVTVNGSKGDHSAWADNSEEEARESYSPTVMPSEYVRSMDKRDKFDARKMGLSSKTFDDALSSMLNDEVRELAYPTIFYDQYARSSGSKPPVRRATSFHTAPRRTTPPSQQQMSRTPEREKENKTPEREKDKEREREREKEKERSSRLSSVVTPDHTGKAASAWGPEAKNYSIAQRLAQFLSDDKQSKPDRQPPATVQSARSAKSVTFIDRLAELQSDNLPRETGAKSPRIQALQDTQREPTYMNRVQAERDRVAKIRRARDAAETIQRAWRHFCRRTK